MAWHQTGDKPLLKEKDLHGLDKLDKILFTHIRRCNKMILTLTSINQPIQKTATHDEYVEA